LLAGLISLAVSPAEMAFSRYLEHEADRFALEVTRDNHAAATAFVKLQQENLMIPRPGLLYELWRGSHPSVGERIDFSNEYRPWEKGAPLKYADRFQQ
jgi:Zn-dependent protease with chaperone function